MKAQSTAENTEHSRSTEDRLLGLYRKYCSGRGWEPKPCAFRDLMFEAAKVYMTQDAELERHGKKLSCPGSPVWAQTEDACARHAIQMAYLQLFQRGVDVGGRQNSLQALSVTPGPHAMMSENSWPSATVTELQVKIAVTLRCCGTVLLFNGIHPAPKMTSLARMLSPMNATYIQNNGCNCSVCGFEFEGGKMVGLGFEEH